MGWPEAFVAVVVSINGVAIAWVGTRQQQVKRALNGTDESVAARLVELERIIHSVFTPPAPETPLKPSERRPGVYDDFG